MPVKYSMNVDNRINVSDEYTIPVSVSGTNANYYQIQPDGNSFVSQITFNNVITPSMSNTIVSKTMRLHYQIVVGGTADALLPKPTPAGTNPILGCLRAYPLQSVCTTASITLNGSTSTINSRSVLSALQRTIPKHLQTGYLLEAPTQPDNLAILVADDAAQPCSGQVLSGILNSPNGDTRGCFAAVSYDAGSFSYVFDVTESLMISPLNDNPDESGLPLVNTLSLVLTYSNLLDMFVFGAAGTNAGLYPAGITVQIRNPKLDLTYVTVQDNVVQVPSMYMTDYTNIVPFSRSSGQTISQNALVNTIAQTDTLRLTSTPDLIYFVRPQLTATRDLAAQGSQSWSDFFFQLGTGGTNGAPIGLNITFGNRTGLCSSMDLQTAYQLYRKNGGNQSWQHWLNAGCMLILAPNSDFGLSVSDGDVFPGMTGNVNFQLQVSFNNSNVLKANSLSGGSYAAPIPFETVTVICYSGICSLTPSSCVYSTGYLSEAEIATLLNTANPEDGSKFSSQQMQPTIQGRGLFGKAKSLLSHIARGVSAVAPIVGQVAAMAQHPIVQSLAGSGLQGGIMSGAALRRRR